MFLVFFLYTNVLGIFSYFGLICVWEENANIFIEGSSQKMRKLTESRLRLDSLLPPNNTPCNQISILMFVLFEFQNSGF